MVLVETILGMARSLPQSHEGARFSEIEIYKRLPSLFTSWNTLLLEPKFRELNHGPRNGQESRTLSDVADLLLTGSLLPALMIILGRLKALAEVAAPESSGWTVARHHELIRVDDMGILTRRDRENAVLDQRDSNRMSQAGHALQPSRRAR